MSTHIEENGFIVHRINYEKSQEADAHETISILKNYNQAINWLIVDHYDLDKVWEMKLKAYVDRIMVIDDFLNRPHQCDLFLNQNYLEQRFRLKYWSLLPKRCKVLLGPKYALLRPEFREMRKKRKNNTRNEIRRVFLFCGGTDPTNETVKALKAIAKLTDLQLTVDVIVGAGNPNRKEVKEICDKLPNTNFHFQVNNIAELMSLADLYIGSAGTVTWERYCLGLPGLIIAVADNQVSCARISDKLGFDCYLGESKDVTIEELARAIRNVSERPNRLLYTGDRAQKLVDGKGVLRVVSNLLCKSKGSTKKT